MTIAIRGKLITVSETSANNVRNALSDEELTILDIKGSVNVYDKDSKSLITIYDWKKVGV